MNKKYAKIAAAILGITIMTTALIPIIAPDAITAAKWYIAKDDDTTRANKDEEAIVAYKITETDAIEEAVVVKQNGELERVAVVEEKSEPVVVHEPVKEEIENLQKEAETGDKPWLLDPVLVIRTNAQHFGFDDTKDTFTAIAIDKVYGNAKVLVDHDGRHYLVRLGQPAGAGTNKIWQIISIQEVKTVTKPSNNGQVDVGPGVEGLDYDKVVKWQQNVDAGRELWRLNPLEVARQEGKIYGFTEHDTFSIVRQYSSTALARHGQIDMEVTHNGKVYHMILVKPFGGRDAIWTIYTVSTPGKPAPETPAPTEKIIFSTDKYDKWHWYKGQYPQDFSVAVLADRKDIKEDNVLADELKKVNFNDKIAIAVYLGSAPGGGYDIGIEKVTLKGNQMTVLVHTKSPRRDEVNTKNITFPADYVVLDQSVADIWGGLNVTFVDQSGKTLAKAKVSIKH